MFLTLDRDVTPTIPQDYAAWHRGRSIYSLWYLSLDCPELVNYAKALQQRFSDYLFTPNTRQLHITLFVCGFWQTPSRYSDDFSPWQLQQQQQQLDQLDLSSFSLQIQGINSFESALFLQVHDPKGHLNTIRRALSTVHTEIAPLDYCPHITLGLYRHACSGQEIWSLIDQMDTPSFELNIQALHFGGYQAQVLQGPLQVLHEYRLGEAYA